jgi:hypothetical protein
MHRAEHGDMFMKRSSDEAHGESNCHQQALLSKQNCSRVSTRIWSISVWSAGLTRVGA